MFLQDIHKKDKNTDNRFQLVRTRNCLCWVIIK